MSETLVNMAMHDIRVDFIPIDGGESGGSDEGSNEKGSSEFNHCELDR